MILLLAFYYSCYDPYPTEVIYEGTNTYDVYYYDTYECGMDYYESEGWNESEPRSEVVEEPQIFIPWRPSPWL